MEARGYRLSDYGKNESVRFRLEKDDERNLLKKDTDAWMLVYNARSHGDELASKIWEFLKINSPEEFETIVNHIVEDVMYG